MPSQNMPSSFASMAAGQGSRDSRRGDGRGSGDWARRENNRSANGTAVLRRSTTAPNSQQASQEVLIPPTPSAETYAQSQHLPNPQYEAFTETRYSKSHLLDIFKAQQYSDSLNGDVGRLFAENWDPGHSNGTTARGWGKPSDSRESYGPDVCWDSSGQGRPIGLEEMSDSEKMIFASDINSPLKPPPQNASKDLNLQGGLNGRKTSISHGQGGNNFSMTSPVSSRPSTRRRETSDSIPSGLNSPAGVGGRFSRDESSPFFLSRKGNDIKDGPDDRAEDAKTNSPFGTLMRSSTAGSALGNGPASPWGPAPPGASFSPMGNFGSFGSSANAPTAGEKRPAFGSIRGESRFANIMQKESSEEVTSKAAEKSWRSRPRTDTDPFDDDGPTGSAALGGGQDISPPSNSQRQAIETPNRGIPSDFGMSNMPGFQDAIQRGQNQQTPQGHHSDHEPLSPSDTNPYRSPPDERGERMEADDSSFDGETSQQNRLSGLGGIPEHVHNTFGNLPRGFASTAFDGSDRSQTSSAGASKGFPPLGGLPSLSNMTSLSGWPTSGNPIGTPDRENRPGFPGAFGNSIFNPGGGDLQSPGLSGMFGQGSSTNLASGNNTVSRGSKLGSLFPPAMQAQMHGAENENTTEGGDIRQSSVFGAIGRNAFPPSRDTDSPIRTNRLLYEDSLPSNEGSHNQGPFSSADTIQPHPATSFPQATSAQLNYQQSQTSSDSTSNQLPTAQQRMMVMPDRMRWVYLDPQGQVQGPWSGLEMHDWYKASFFTADLSVKKVEDAEFEPLGQLIRRIGNSREPFLVPQIGIPHGPATTQAGAPFTPAAAAPGNAAAQPGVVQPPFAGAFPSFGTTLTAEQQNNLERRKQEEQYLMARQREFLAQQQVNMKQMQMSGIPSSLHHHSSAHSLQSQPSFGSMTSPIGMPPQPPMPGVSGFFDGPARQAPSQVSGGLPPDFFREEDLARLSLQERQQQFGASLPGPLGSHNHQIGTLFGQQADAQREASRMDQLRQNDPQGFKARLREFEQLRAQHDLEEAGQSSADAMNEPIGPLHQPQHMYQEPLEHQQEEQPEPKVPESLSLTQQVQKAASAKQSPVPATQPESPWGKVNTSLPMPFPPPPQSTTPLPAPTAQRGRSNLPDALNAEARSRSETPEVSAAPSVAPWAKEPTEAPKGPSLKEIQEAEAKKAAKAEEIAAAARRVAHEQEMKMLSIQPSAPALGLPTTSTWGNTASPLTPTSAPSAWAKPSASKSQVASSTTATKKTLADIQREEELRKQKLAATTAASVPAGMVGGKRYADLASKPTSSPASGAAWSTVGAGGKVKVPTGPAATTSPAIRSSSNTSVTTTASVRPRPSPAIRSDTSSGQTGIANANEEFTKWAKGALAKGLNSDINIDNFVLMLSTFPPEAGIIADSVYSNSQLMDGRRFAEEYLRRRKLAEKGVIEPFSTGSSAGFAAGEKSGGWSEVAKKGPPKEEPPAGFKVVPNKKKGKK